MTLPIINARVRVYNQTYNPKDPTSDFQIWELRDVEVVQLNLNSQGMRVRFVDQYQGKNKVVSQDISIRTFYDQYQIVKLETSV